MSKTTPLEKIRYGIALGNWQFVCEGYEAMTGTVMSPPKAENTFPPDFAGYLANKVRAIIRDYPKTGGVCGSFGNDQEWEDGPVDNVGDDDATELGVQPQEEETNEKLEAELKHQLPVDDASVRARELVDARNNVKPATDDEYDKFKVVNGTAKRDDNRRSCRVEPFAGAGKNKWKDTGKLAVEDIKESKRMNAAKAPEPRRPAVKKVEVQCCKCDKKEFVEPIFAPKGLDKGDQSNYVCNPCIKRGKGK